MLVSHAILDLKCDVDIARKETIVSNFNPR